MFVFDLSFLSRLLFFFSLLLLLNYSYKFVVCVCVWFFSIIFCVVCCIHFLFTYFKIYIVFIKFNLGCCPIAMHCWWTHGLASWFRNRTVYYSQASLNTVHLKACDVEVTLDHLQLFLLLVAWDKLLLDLDYVLKENRKQLKNHIKNVCSRKRNRMKWNWIKTQMTYL